ncbi:hypothetical protein E1B28_004752 [Marasmius oreades]|uniref:Decapping nuclease n=1 Tax=Marasmius oreades TaxID=181124 RepID=A0A9P7UZA9_9AGAR|nr:uncharacterized protein E1B28_004752 [Marasmius oreades]KAG7097402.1 hypothetical protein E1B28_004752 [Marasmius oreades]
MRKPFQNAHNLTSILLTPTFHKKTRTGLRLARLLSTAVPEECSYTETFLSTTAAPRLSIAQFGPPKQVACYSRTSISEFRPNDSSSLRRFIEPTIGTTLTWGLVPFFDRDKGSLRHVHQPTRLDPLLKACLHPHVSRSFLKADVVTTKKVLVSLLHGIGSFNVSFIGGKLYIDQYCAEKRWKISDNGYVGRYGFKRACTALYEQSRQKQAPHGLNDWYGVISRSIGGINLLFAGEIPCIKAPYTGQPDCYMELNCRKLGHRLQKDMKDWYFQAHVMGSSGIFIGYRDTAHVLRKTEFIATQDLLGRLNMPWNPQDSINNLFQVLYVLRNYCQQMFDQRELRNEHRKEDITWRITIRGKFLGGFSIREVAESESEPLRRMDGKVQQKRIGIVPAALIKELQKHIMKEAFQ